MGSCLGQAWLVLSREPEEESEADSPSPPANEVFVDTREILNQEGEKGHFEKPLESLLSHLFSSWEGSVFHT